MYWALYDQQGSVWLIQGIQMDCRIWGSTLLLPDQMQSINSLLILLFIPIFQVIIYPTVSKFVTITPLRKMVTGGILASLAFVSSGIVQLQINKTLPELPPENFGYVTVMNSLREGCNFSGTGDYSFRSLAFNDSLVYDKLKNLNEMIKVPAGDNITFHFTHSCKNGYVSTYTAPLIKNKKIYNLIVTELGAVILQVNPDKPKKGTGEFSLSITMGLNDTNYVGHLALCRVKSDSEKSKYPCDPTTPKDFHYFQVNYDNEKDTDLDSVLPFYNNNGFDSEHYVSGYTFKAIQPGKWSFWYMHNMATSVGALSTKPEDLDITTTGQYIDIGEQGGVYAAVFTGTYKNPIFTINQIVPSNTVSILWQVPQFVIITLAEILFSITGYEFAYSQAAPSMKSLVQACWILTTAIGDSIIVLIAVLALFDNLATQFFVYAGNKILKYFFTKFGS
uniref:Uncharacterized protein n=1 Tax=Panagrolaimus davidi TaxID=227884 RepID=A0A914QNW5_9BILA